MKTWKIQKFFGDLVYDLRSRGLLPVAILLVAGMFAVPFLISGGASSPSGPATATPTAAELAPENQAAVLAYNPGVRNYKQRLKELSSQDPFVQQFTAPAVSAAPAEAAGSTGSTDTGSTGIGTTGDPTGGSTDPGTGTTGGSGGGSTKIETRYFFYSTDVEVGEADGDMDRKNGIDPFDYFPAPEIPVLVFLGNLEDKSAVFLVSKDVLSQDGAGSCFPAPESCQLLALKAGESQDLVYGIDNKTYRIKVKRVRLKVTKKKPKD